MSRHLPDAVAPILDRSGTSRLTPLLLLFSLFGVNCSEAATTQLVVLVDTDYAVPAEVDRIRAHVAKIVDTEGSVEEVETWVREFPVSNDEPADANSYRLPATFAVLPSASDIDREIVIELEAIATSGQTVLVSRRLRTGFVPGEARLVRMLIHRACAGLSCAEGDSCGCPGATSCATPSCVDERVSPADLEVIDDPALLPPDSEFPSTPGGGPDGGTDGGLECEPSLVLCDEECVNTLTDLRYCGGCNNACPDGFACETGVCADLGDCRAFESVCTGFTYCDESTGKCIRGCTNDDQCVRDQEICDVGAHECLCAPGFDRCAFDCVDTESDPRFCGTCLSSCVSGEVCEGGVCVDLGDCRSNGFGCSGFTYCDEATGDCLPGCEENAQCTGDDRVCNTDLHECVCDLDFHECDGVCVSDLDVATCGTSCAPCPFPQGALPICVSGVCDFVCEDGLDECDSTCVDTQIDARFCGSCTNPCLAGDLCEGGVCLEAGDCRTNGTGCTDFNYCDANTGNCLPGCDDNAQCTATNEVCNLASHDCECATGFHPCGGACVSDLDASACGALCIPCSAPPGATPICLAGACDFICADGLERCDDLCCPTGVPPV